MKPYAPIVATVLATTIAVRSVFAVDPLLIAHRGLLRHAPENTLPAFAACLELGVGFELDIRTTKDGELVVLHDDTLGRTTDGPNRSVREFTLAELKQLDAGSWFHTEFRNVRIPTLEETFLLIKQRQRQATVIALNIKDITRDGEKHLVELVEEYELTHQAFAFDQSDDCSHRLKAMNRNIRIGANVKKNSIEAILADGALDVCLLSFVPSAETFERIRKTGKQVVLNFSGNAASRRDPAMWTTVKQAGVKSILTDYPLEFRLHWNRARFETAAQSTAQ